MRCVGRSRQRPDDFTACRHLRSGFDRALIEILAGGVIDDGHRQSLQVGSRSATRSQRIRALAQHAAPRRNENHNLTGAGETFVVTCGPEAGPPVLLLHGGGVNSSMWLDALGDLGTDLPRVFDRLSASPDSVHRHGRPLQRMRSKFGSMRCFRGLALTKASWSAHQWADGLRSTMWHGIRPVLTGSLFWHRWALDKPDVFHAESPALDDAGPMGPRESPSVDDWPGSRRRTVRRSQAAVPGSATFPRPHGANFVLRTKHCQTSRRRCFFACSAKRTQSFAPKRPKIV